MRLGESSEVEEEGERRVTSERASERTSERGKQPGTGPEEDGHCRYDDSHTTNGNSRHGYKSEQFSLLLSIALLMSDPPNRRGPCFILLAHSRPRCPAPSLADSTVIQTAQRRIQ